MPLPQLNSPLKDIRIFECKSSLFIIGKHYSSDTFRILEVSRQINGGISLHQFDRTYKSLELDDFIASLFAKHPDLNLLCDCACCLFGFIRLFESTCLIVITQKRKVGSINGHYIYAIDKTQTIAIDNKLKSTREESRYRKILASFDLTKGCYFSYTYDISNTLQRNFIRGQKLRDYFHSIHKSLATMTSINTPLYTKCHGMFVWNSFAVKPLLQLDEKSNGSCSSNWVVPVMYGFFEQKVVHLKGNQLLRLTLIGRRSRYFAGTRYLRRGVNSDGHVANEVETEFIVTREASSSSGEPPRSASMVQVRGSIPLFWSHTSILSPKPDIRIEETDPDHIATRRHFQRLFERYGRHVVVLSLVRQAENKPKEALLGSAYGDVCSTLNDLFREQELLVQPQPQAPLLTTANSQSTDPGPRKEGQLGVSEASQGRVEVERDLPGKPQNQIASEEQDRYEPLDEDQDMELHPTVGLTEARAQSNLERWGLGVDSKETSDSIYDTFSALSPIDYMTYDFLNNISNNVSVFNALEQISEVILPMIGYFVEEPHSCRRSPTSLRLDKISSEYATDVSGGPVEGLENKGYMTFPLNQEPDVPLVRPESVNGDGLDADEHPTSKPTPFAKINDQKLQSSTLHEIKLQLYQLMFESDFESAAPSQGPSSEESHGLLGAPVGMLQYGVLRTNCIDCLDRTNVSQFSYCSVALPKQLRALGIELSPASLSSLQKMLMEMWAEHGDAIANQYAGSGAMHKMDESAATNTPGGAEKEFVLTGGAKNALVAVQRYYSNVLSDFERQQAMDLLLGIFEPRPGSRHVWELKQGPENLRSGAHGRRRSEMMEAVTQSAPSTTVTDDNPLLDETALQESLHEMAVIKQQLEGQRIVLEVTGAGEGGRGYSSCYYDEDQHTAAYATLRHLLDDQPEESESEQLDWKPFFSRFPEKHNESEARLQGSKYILSDSRLQGSFASDEMVLEEVKVDPSDILLYEAYAVRFLLEGLPGSVSTLSGLGVHNNRAEIYKIIRNMRKAEAGSEGDPPYFMGKSDGYDTNSSSTKQIGENYSHLTESSNTSLLKRRNIKPPRRQSSSVAPVPRTDLPITLSTFPTIEEGFDDSDTKAQGGSKKYNTVSEFGEAALQQMSDILSNQARPGTAVGSTVGTVGAILAGSAKISSLASNLTGKNIPTSSSKVFQKSFWGFSKAETPNPSSQSTGSDSKRSSSHTATFTSKTTSPSSSPKTTSSRKIPPGSTAGTIGNQAQQPPATDPPRHLNTETKSASPLAMNPQTATMPSELKQNKSDESSAKENPVKVSGPAHPAAKSVEKIPVLNEYTALVELSILTPNDFDGRQNMTAETSGGTESLLETALQRYAKQISSIAEDCKAKNKAEELARIREIVAQIQRKLDST